MSNNYSDGDLVASAIVAREAGLALGDRVFVGAHPVFAAGYLGDLGSSSSGTINKELGDWGDEALNSVAEATSMGGATDFTFTSLSATVSRQGLHRNVSRLLGVLEPTGKILDPAMFGYDAASAWGKRFTELSATVGATFTKDAGGTSEAPLEWDVLIDATSSLEADEADVDEGNVVAILHPKQWGDLRKQLTSTDLGDAMTHAPEAYQGIVAKKLGYKGRFYGIDVYTTNQVPKNAGNTDYVGCILTPQSVAWADAKIPATGRPEEIMVDGGKLQIWMDYDADKFVVDVHYNAVFGLAKGIDKAGRTVTSGV